MFILVYKFFVKIDECWIVVDIYWDKFIGDIMVYSILVYINWIYKYVYVCY